MAEFGQVILTNKGRDLLAASVTGEKTKFSKAVAGDGLVPGFEDVPVSTDKEHFDLYVAAVAEMTQLVHPVRDLQIRATYAPEGTGGATVKTRMTNAGLLQFFLMREVGLYVPDPKTGKDVLYGYCNAGNKWTHIAAQDGPDVTTYNFDFHIKVGQAEVLTLLVGDPMNVTLPELEEYLDLVLQDGKKREARLQRQIDLIVEAVTLGALNYAEKKLLAQNEEAE